jgi:hypothetical protein
VNTYNNTQLSQIRDDNYSDSESFVARETDSLLGEDDHDIEQPKNDAYSTPVKTRSPTPTKDNPSPLPVAINFVGSPAETTGIVGVSYKRVAYIVIQCSAIKEL